MIRSETVQALAIYRLPAEVAKCYKDRFGMTSCDDELCWNKHARGIHETAKLYRIMY